MIVELKMSQIKSSSANAYNAVTPPCPIVQTKREAMNGCLVSCYLHKRNNYECALPVLWAHSLDEELDVIERTSILFVNVVINYIVVEDDIYINSLHFLSGG